MDFITFVDLLLTNGIDVESSVSKKLFEDFKPFLIQPDLDPYAMLLLRAKLTGSTVHEELARSYPVTKTIL